MTIFGVHVLTFIASVVVSVFFADAVRSFRKWLWSKLFKS